MNFLELKYVKKDWNWGDLEQVNPYLIDILNRYGEYLHNTYGAKIALHNAYSTSGHSKKSQHYKGNACDIHVVGIDLFTAWLASLRFPFTGIGIYPEWNNPGLHLDVRYLDRINRQPVKKAMWSYYNKKYRAIDKNLLEVLCRGLKST